MTSLGAKFRSLFARDATPKVRVHVLVKGRIGAGWHDVDRTFALPVGTTLEGLLDAAEGEGVKLREAIANSPHLRHTLMLNGDRCPLDEHRDRVLNDGDQVYLLAPLAGG